MQPLDLYVLQNLRNPLLRGNGESLALKNKRILRPDFYKDTINGPQFIEKKRPVWRVAFLPGHQNFRNQQDHINYPIKSNQYVPGGYKEFAGHLPSKTKLSHFRPTRNQAAIWLYPMDGKLSPLRIQCSTPQQLPLIVDKVNCILFIDTSN